MTAPRTILVPTDFSETADHALAFAVELAAKFDATVHLLHVVSIPAAGLPEIGMAYAAIKVDDLMLEAQKALDERVARYRDRVAMQPGRLDVGDARDVIDRVAAEIGADLIVMGTHGRRGIRRVLLGSVAESVVRSAPCSVLTVRPKQS